MRALLDTVIVVSLLAIAYVVWAFIDIFTGGL